MPSTSEEALARLCVAVDTASADAELSAANAAPVTAAQLSRSGEVLQAGATELLTGLPDERLARRVSRLAGALMHGSTPQIPAVFDGLCAYGALAPTHHAQQLVRIYKSRPGSIALALPAVLMMPAECDELVPLLGDELTRATNAGDEDTLCLAASALIAVYEKTKRPLVPAIVRAARDARSVARDSGMQDAQTELNNLLQLAPLP